jgi:HD-like signal output (HDOD) protein
MRKKQNRSPQQWIEKIAQHELPTITSTANLLSKFADDDVTSLPKLSQAILHDQALSSCMIKVANSNRRGVVSKVTTVSRATVVLGLQTVKNICLTAKVLDSLLANHHLSTNVYNRLTTLMTNSFYAGLLAKMMLPDHDEKLQEEIYLAAMLYRIGETSFWSMGGQEVEELIEHISLPEEAFQEQSKEILGIDFQELSVGLAKNWGLGNLLIKSLDSPTNRTKEIQVIFYADKLSSFISSPPKNKKDFDEVIEQICQLMNVTERKLKDRISNVLIDAKSLLSSYDANVLVDNLKDYPTSKDFIDQTSHEKIIEINPEKLQLSALQHLTKLTKECKDLNELLQFTIKSIARILQFDQCCLMVLTGDKTQIKSRFNANIKGYSQDYSIKLPIKVSPFEEVLKTHQSLLINEFKSGGNQCTYTNEVIELLDRGPICIAPVEINSQPIAIIFAQKHDLDKSISNDDFEKFDFFVCHLNMCLSSINRK